MHTPHSPSLPLMAHLVLGYPSLAASIATAETYAHAQVRYIEVQLPFSHPTADGPRITQANQMALQQDIDVAAALTTLVEHVSSVSSSSQCIVMSYANKLLGCGSTTLLRALRSAGLQQLIVPDLPVDSPLTGLLSQQGFSLVPVMAPNTSAARVRQLLATQPKLVYIMGGYALTGGQFGLDARLHTLVANIRSESDAAIGIGFGIRDAADARQVLQLADHAIVGSALLAAADAGRLDEWLQDYASMTAATTTAP